MVNQICALLKHHPAASIAIDIFAGDAQQDTGRQLENDIQQWTRRHNVIKPYQLRLVQIDALAYNDRPAASRDAFLQESHQLAQTILRNIDLTDCTPASPYVLQIHNPNLGKNARVTAALRQLAEILADDNLPAYLLYQIHDFAEDSRPACWHVLNQCTGAPDPAFAADIMYPRNSRILWTTVNTADRRRLLSTHLPEERVTALPNAVDIDAFTAPPLPRMTTNQLTALDLPPADYADQLRQRLATYAADHGYAFDPNRRILLAPVKAIRRKNIIESVLSLLALNRHDDRYQLLVTLLPNNPHDHAAFDQLDALVKQHRWPVVFGLGHQLIHAAATRRIENRRVAAFALVDLLDLAHAVLTTSVQEGFGYVFHEAWLAQRPVLGRNLPRVTADFTAAGMDLAHLYRQLLIPTDWLTETQWQALIDAYIQKTNQSRTQMGLPEEPPEQLTRRLTENKLTPLDWADLTPDLQLHLLQRLAAEPALLDALRWRGPTDATYSHWYVNDISAIIAHNEQVVASRYSLAATAAHLEAVFQQGRRLLSEPAAPSPPPADNRAIVADCLDISQLRLLT